MNNKKHLLHISYVLGFLVYLHGYLLIYVNSSFLATFTSEQTVGLLFTIGAAIAVLMFIAAPYILRGLGDYKATRLFIIGEFIAVLGLAFVPSLVWVVLFFFCHVVLTRAIQFDADVFLESVSEDSQTGTIRGFFLTITNVALVLSPLTIGFILGDGNNYSRVYLTSALVLIPALFLLVYGFRHFKDPLYKHPPFIATLKRVWKRQNIHKALAMNTMLRLFYAWMVIYTPIYLHEHIGFGWDQIGIIFTIMLLPFVLLEWPLGRLADTRFGEKEMLTIGFIWLAISTALLSFITEPHIVLWTIALFTTRIGASIVEIMSETYFFKQIDGSDTELVSVFRMAGPIAYIVAPLLASLALYVLDIRYTFIVLGVIILFGLRYSLSMKDTR